MNGLFYFAPAMHMDPGHLAQDMFSQPEVLSLFSILDQSLLEIFKGRYFVHLGSFVLAIFYLI
jgi:hypothetical protein